MLAELSSHNGVRGTRASLAEKTYPVKDDDMATVQRRFKVYYGPESETTTAGLHHNAPQTVTVPLSEVLPLLADAVNSRRTWLRDFAGDDITISADLLRSDPGLPASHSPVGLIVGGESFRRMPGGRGSRRTACETARPTVACLAVKPIRPTNSNFSKPRCNAGLFFALNIIARSNPSTTAPTAVERRAIAAATIHWSLELEHWSFTLRDASPDANDAHKLHP